MNKYSAVSKLLLEESRGSRGSQGFRASILEKLLSRRSAILWLCPLRCDESIFQDEQLIARRGVFATLFLNA